ncbi:uncharacterized protein YneR [Paenibacillus phyllosphaerae]|uniref:Uncharacterized protein YneR n=1 Tax=Paenibacillus phyllosphaerae TaxID=274593 RepID=A0A7W5FMQ8_9BACL|nr:hypothetical protein [Paenibacillus phyllosphaerae]MBB3110264.1 uncharacterized protein YneR [Paenibacillus phyllosphaerae]
MKVIVEAEAARWYKKEMALQDGDQLHVFVRLGGCGSVQPGMSLGIMKENATGPNIHQTVEGIDFYMLEEQLWYLDEKDLHIRYDAKHDEAYFHVE